MIRLASTIIGMFFLSAGSVAFAQYDLALDINITKECLAEKNDDQRQACVGAAADICMQTESGGTTVGMGFCLDKELNWWDARLNGVYTTYLAKEKAADKESSDGGFSVPAKAPALKDMQRAWIKYRDALCEHEAVQWGGGTGQGPAFLGCLLSETGRQVFVLEDRMNGWE